MNITEKRGHRLKCLALALTLGVGLGAGSAQAQTIIDVAGAGNIGDQNLTTANVPAAGVNWTVEGSEAGVENTADSFLVSPPVVVPTTGTVTLKFDHRYFFEDNFDGGAVFVSVNGAPATYVPATSFSANGYVGPITGGGTAWTGGEDVFHQKSAGYDTPTLIQSVADIGTLDAGDTVSVEFRGIWDAGYVEDGTDWEIGTVTIEDSVSTAILDVDFTTAGASGFTVVDNANVSDPWTYLKPVSRFEIDADLLTADRYAPTAPGTNIDLSGADIAVVLLTGTLDAGETFTLFDLSEGTTLSGTPGNINLPPGTWDTSNLEVDGTIVCVAPQPPFTPPTSPPVTDGMIVWVSGDGVDTSDPAQVRVADLNTFVTQWTDYSSNDNHATNTTENDQPTYIADGLNGKPVLRFGQDDENNGDRLYLGDLSADFPAAGSVFVVSTLDNDGRYNLFGNRNNDERWVADTWNEARPGSFRGGRSQSANFTKDDFPTTGSHVFVLESDSSEFEVLIDGDSIGTDNPDYNSGSGQNWTIGNRSHGSQNGQQLRGDIAEVILYNRILTPLEADQVGGYLAQKYGLTTTYPPLDLSVTLTNPSDGVAYPSGSSVMASATVAAGSVGGGTAPYTVEFFVDDVLAGTATTTDPYTLDLGVLADGPHEIYATVTDSTTPAAETATSATHAFTVAPATATTTTLASSANPSTYGSATVTATVVAGDASTLSGGTVQFYAGGAPLGDPVTVDTATGEASYDISTLGVATHEITADYSGDGIYSASSASALSQVVDVASLTVTADDVFRPTDTENPDPLPYTITGYQNGEDLGSSGVTGDPVLTTTATTGSPAADYPITCALGSLSAANYSFTLVNGTLTVAEVPDTFSVNFYANGALPAGEAQDNLRLEPGVAAGVGDWLTSGWANIVAPWNPGAPQPTVTLTSNRGSEAMFTLITCRNGGPYVWNVPRTTLLDDGNGNMMDAHVNSTFQDSEWFDMEVTDIPFATYDVIFYMGANQAQFGDGTGNIVFNGAPVREFKLKSGAFDGTFIDMVDATTEGHYMVFEGVTNSSFTVRTWGNGFNHVGPTGFQIRAAANDYSAWAENYPAADLSDPTADYDGDGVSNDEERLFGLDPTDPASLNPISIPLDAAAGSFSFTRRDDALTGKFADVETSTDLVMWTVDAGAVLVPGTPDANGVETVDVTLSPGLLSAPKLFVRVVQGDGILLSENFEMGDGGFTVATTEGTDWAWGVPDSSGVGGTVDSGNGGTGNCWGTNLGDIAGTGDEGFFADPTLSFLRSGIIDLTGVSGARLSFAEALDLEQDQLGDSPGIIDTGEVYIIDDTDDNPATNVIAGPIYSAVDSTTDASDWAPANGGTPIDIPGAALGQPVRIEWRFTGNGGTTADYMGWYIDDVTVSKVLP